MAEPCKPQLDTTSSDWSVTVKGWPCEPGSFRSFIPPDTKVCRQDTYVLFNFLRLVACRYKLLEDCPTGERPNSRGETFETSRAGMMNLLVAVLPAADKTLWIK